MPALQPPGSADGVRLAVGTRANGRTATKPLVAVIYPTGIATAVRIPRLAAGTDYTVTVRAVDTGGNRSAFAGQVTFTTAGRRLRSNGIGTTAVAVHG